MGKQIISHRVLNEVEDYLTWQYTLSTIQRLFDQAGIECDETFQPKGSLGERRTLTQQYYNSLDLSDWEDVKHLLSVLESVLEHIERQLSFSVTATEGQSLNDSHDRLIDYLKKDGFYYANGKLSAGASVPGAETLKAVAEALDSAYMQRQMATIDSNIESHPDLAIGTAKELVETVCKTILDEHGIAHAKNWDVPKLSKEVFKVLRLTRDDIPANAKASDIIKRMLSNLATIPQNLAELRNAYGTGHGKAASSKGLNARHARLAANAAITLASFLYETFEEQKEA